MGLFPETNGYNTMGLVTMVKLAKNTTSDNENGLTAFLPKTLSQHFHLYKQWHLYQYIFRFRYYLIKILNVKHIKGRFVSLWIMFSVNDSLERTARVTTAEGEGRMTLVEYSRGKTFISEKNSVRNTI